MIVIDLESVEVRPDGTATGVIYWDVEGIRFPEVGWNDFVVVVIEWWVQALVRFLQGGMAHVTLDFMDGPFSVNIRKANGEVEMAFVDRRHEIPPHATVPSDIGKICRMVIGAANSLCQHLDVKGVATHQVKRIRRLCDDLADLQ
jgi:hypothetical protein